MQQVEKMDEFFNQRVSGYDQHMEGTVQDGYYQSISEPIKETENKIKILDLGIGTGIELEKLFKKVPNAQIIGVDLSEGMLKQLLEKYSSFKEQITTIKGSYFHVPFGHKKYDFIISSMTMHHFLEDKKVELYKKIKSALNDNGMYIEGDYIVNENEEKECLEEYFKILEGLPEKEINGDYHIDIPFTREKQERLLREAGFTNIEIIWQEGSATTMVVR